MRMALLHRCGNCIQSAHTLPSSKGEKDWHAMTMVEGSFCYTNALAWNLKATWKENRVLKCPKCNYLVLLFAKRFLIEFNNQLESLINSAVSSCAPRTKFDWEIIMSVEMLWSWCTEGEVAEWDYVYVDGNIIIVNECVRSGGVKVDNEMRLSCFFCCCVGNEVDDGKMR